MPVNITTLTSVHLGSFDWVWDICQHFILKNDLIDHIDEYVITSNLDADDAWRLDVIGSVNAIVKHELKTMESNLHKRSTWTNHSSGLAITFPFGMHWLVNKNSLHPFLFDFHSMSVFIVSKFSSGVSCCSSRHAQWPQFSEVVQFKIIKQRQDQAMWLYSLHDEQVFRWNAFNDEKIPKEYEKIFYEEYGINEKKIKKWKKKYPAHNSNSHSGKSASEKYNLIFKITYLNKALIAYREQGNKNLNKKILATERDRLICINKLSELN